MSTKTTFKRIALVAVAALGLGLVSTVPATAAGAVASKVSSIALAADVSTVATGATSTVSVTPTLVQVAANGDVVTIKGYIQSKPAGSVVGITTTAGATVKTITLADTASTANLGVIAGTVGTAATGVGTALFGTMAVTSNVAGAVVLRVWNDAGDGAAINGVVDPGEAYQDITITFGSTALGNPELADYADASSTAALNVSAVGVTVTSTSGRIGVPVAFAPNFTLTNGTGGALATNTKSAKLMYTVTTPAGTAQTVVTAALGTTADGGIQYVAGAQANNVVGGGNLPAAATSVASNKGTNVYFTPATAGTYTITVFHDADRLGLRSAGEAVATATVVVAADALPSITGTVYGSTTPALSATGVLVKLALTNGTAAAALAPNETLTLTAPTDSTFNAVSKMTGTTFAMNGTASTTATQTLTSANFNGSGVAYVMVGNSTAGGGTYTVTGNVTGGTANGAAGSFTFSVLDTSGVAATGYDLKADSAADIKNVNTLLGVAGATVAKDTDTTIWTVKQGVATTVKASLATTTKGQYYQAAVTDSLGLLTGMVGARYIITGTTSRTTAPTAAYLSLAIPATTALLPTATTVATIEIDNAGDDNGAGAFWNGGTSDLITINTGTAAPTYFYVNPTADASAYTIRAGAATTNKFTVSVTDQYGNAMGGVALTAAVAGRNSTVVYPSFLTNASGQFDISLTDSYTGTFLTTDTLTVYYGGVAKGTITVNYATYLPASTITLTTPDSAAAAASGIAGSVTTDIYAQDGAENGAVAVKAVVKDANGATLPAGVPVTFKVSGNAGSAILSTYVTVLTGADGSATTYVYAWTNGNTVVTATCGTATKDGIVYFKQSDAVDGVQAEARTIKASAAGNVVTATVTDRFGNPIKGINVVATRVGTGTFNGTSSLTGVTDKAGQVQFVLTNGTADVTVSFTSTTFGQSAATKGYVNAGVTAFTAYTAGTVALAEAGVGASFDAAGVNSATVLAVTDTAAVDTAQAAADAAAEATDAANAATDAANAAAEAADAATAAAQDAADAVAALSTQVTEMVSALKKQITALTNLVIKIQKKVKA